MFELTNNNFSNPEKQSCKYKDEYGNTCYMRRSESGIVAKLRFADKRVTAPSLEISFPPKDDEFGVYLTLSCDGEEVGQEFLDNLSDDISTGIQGFTEVLQRWMQMLYDIKFLEFDNSILLGANEGMTIDDVYREKFDRISHYEELAPVVDTVFKGNAEKMSVN